MNWIPRENECLVPTTKQSYCSVYDELISPASSSNRKLAQRSFAEVALLDLKRSDELLGVRSICGARATQIGH